MSSPKETHLLAAKRILRYLQGTRDFGIFYIDEEKNLIWLDSLIVTMQGIHMTEKAYPAMFL
jgi:hypothetical protein